MTGRDARGLPARPDQAEPVRAVPARRSRRSVGSGRAEPDAGAASQARALGNQAVWRLRLSDPSGAPERAAEQVAQGRADGPGARPDNAAPGRGPAPGLPPAVLEALAGPGRALAPQGHPAAEVDGGPGAAPDGVQVHTGPVAADLARALGARAFTIGQHIVFGAGQYAPATKEGRQTLAHEAEHVRSTGRAGTGVIPVQRRLVLTGATADIDRVIAIMNHRLSPVYRAQAGPGGEVQVVPTGISGPLIAPNQVFSDRLRVITGDSGTTTVDVVASGVPIVGSYALSRIDVADMEALGFDQEGWDAGAALLHELVEQRERQLGTTAAQRAFGSETTGAHGTALAAELGVIGAALESDSGLVPSRTRTPGGGLSGTRTVVFRYPDGRRVQVIVTLTNNNITRVRRRRLP